MADTRLFPLEKNRARVLCLAFCLSCLINLLLLRLAPVPAPQTVSPKNSGIDIELDSLPPALASPESGSLPAQPQTSPATDTPTATPALPPKKNIPLKKEKSPAKRQPKTQTPARRVSQPANASAPAAKTAFPVKTSSSTNITPIPATPPVPLGGASTPKPEYPQLARKRGQEGTVNVRCEVDASGSVTAVFLAKSSGFRLLDEAALKTLRQWRFRPAGKDGANVAGAIVVPVQFRLE